MKKLLSIVVVTGVLALTACGTEGETNGGLKPEAKPSETPTQVVEVPKDAKPGDFPKFNEDNYTFVYERSCYCPVTGKVKVVVKDGKAVEATYLDNDKEVLEYELLTINDMIEEANTADAVEFKWPEGQAYPSSLGIDRMENAIDDEVGFKIVEVTVQ